MVPSRRNKGFQETGVFPMSFGFTLVKAVSSYDRVALEPRGKKGEDVF